MRDLLPFGIFLFPSVFYKIGQNLYSRDGKRDAQMAGWIVMDTLDS